MTEEIEETEETEHAATFRMRATELLQELAPDGADAGYAENYEIVWRSEALEVHLAFLDQCSDMDCEDECVGHSPDLWRVTLEVVSGLFSDEEEGLLANFTCNPEGFLEDARRELEGLADEVARRRDTYASLETELRRLANARGDG